MKKLIQTKSIDNSTERALSILTHAMQHFGFAVSTIAARASDGAWMFRMWSPFVHLMFVAKVARCIKARR